MMEQKEIPQTDIIFNPARPHEECGVFGLFSPYPKDAAHICYYGLYALQHRGQESAGIVVCQDGDLSAVKDTGLVSEAFSADALKALELQEKSQEESLKNLKAANADLESRLKKAKAELKRIESQLQKVSLLLGE